MMMMMKKKQKLKTNIPTAVTSETRTEVMAMVTNLYLLSVLTCDLSYCTVSNKKSCLAPQPLSLSLSFSFSPSVQVCLSEAKRDISSSLKKEKILPCYNYKATRSVYSLTQEVMKKRNYKSYYWKYIQATNGQTEKVKV